MLVALLFVKKIKNLLISLNRHNSAKRNHNLSLKMHTKEKIKTLNFKRSKKQQFFILFWYFKVNNSHHKLPQCYNKIQSELYY